MKKVKGFKKRKVLEEPKEFKHPRLYWREARGRLEFYQRLRIIYPNGHAEWADALGFGGVGYWYEEPPCWSKVNQTAKEAIKLMKKFDKNMGFTTIFLGEIK